MFLIFAMTGCGIIYGLAIGNRTNKYIEIVPVWFSIGFGHLLALRYGYLSSKMTKFKKHAFGIMTES
uniref:Transmembrane protein n=1 Tax=Pithovirus LCDPAC01 TaxID=2506600 RepID=A0A481YPE8_9VIRU|nr:MAG: hypothetical protein LCDPAC01_01530 [Pithovirus LCDPAC01]